MCNDCLILCIRFKATINNLILFKIKKNFPENLISLNTIFLTIYVMYLRIFKYFIKTIVNLSNAI